MLAFFSIFVAAAQAIATSRSFAPQAPDELKFNKERVWVRLHEKCFASESEVRGFKDFLVQEYECVDFDERREKIHQTPSMDGTLVWSLWLELDGDSWNFDCLSTNVSLPIPLLSECVDSVYYEPLQHTTDLSTCEDQATGDTLWSLDVLDGRSDGLYAYMQFGGDSAVEAIVLDTNVDVTHVEFAGIAVNNLFSGTLDARADDFHGTHVSGSILGSVVGGAKGTPLNYYPVCQQDSGCGWSDIEGGYESAIALMRENPSTTYVINYSVGGAKSRLTTPSYDQWGAAINEAGGFWVTSAGNSAADACQFSPAYSTQAITVGAYDDTLSPATRFTNYGACVDTWGPGDYVYSAGSGGTYATASGTSMSSPNVAAIVINVLKENHQNYDLAAMKSYLQNNAAELENVPSSWAGSNTRAYFAPCND